MYLMYQGRFLVIFSGFQPIKGVFSKIRPDSGRGSYQKHEIDVSKVLSNDKHDLLAISTKFGVKICCSF